MSHSGSLLQKYIAQDSSLRAAVIDGSDIVREMQTVQNSYPVATMAVGRSMLAASLMASFLKQNQMLSLYFRGDGPLQTVFAEATQDGEVRGYCPHPQVSLPTKADGSVNVGAGIGEGLLTVVKTTPYQKAPQRGSVDIQTGEIGDDVAFYLQQSHQIPSIMAVGVKLNSYGLVLAAGGVHIELLPGADQQVIPYLEKRLKQSGSVSEMVEKQLQLNEILEVFLGTVDFKPLGESTAVKYSCRCSLDRVKRSLQLLGEIDLKKMVQQKVPTEVRCEFCGQLYKLESSDILEALAELKKAKLH